MEEKLTKIENITCDIFVSGLEAYIADYKRFQAASKKLIMGGCWWARTRPKTSFIVRPKKLNNLEIIRTIDFFHAAFELEGYYYITKEIHPFTSLVFDTIPSKERFVIFEQGPWEYSFAAGFTTYRTAEYNSVAVQDTYCFEESGEFETHLFVGSNNILLKTENYKEFINKLSEVKIKCNDLNDKDKIHSDYVDLITGLCNYNIKKVGKLKVNIHKESNYEYKVNLTFKNIKIFEAYWDGGKGIVEYGFAKKGKWEEDLIPTFKKELEEYLTNEREKEYAKQVKLQKILDTY